MNGQFDLVVSARSSGGMISFLKVYINLVANYKMSNIRIKSDVSQSC